MDGVKDVGGSRAVLVAAVEALQTAVTGLATAVSTADLTATGDVILSGLPTSDPAVAGQLWANTGVVTVSAG